MLSNFRRKTGAASTMPGTPRLQPEPPAMEMDGGLQSLLSLPMTEDWQMNDGFQWPGEFSPSALPVWLQDGVSSLTGRADRRTLPILVCL
jgi:hypothetical protein